MTWHPITLTRKELYDKVWSQPVQTLAKEYGISDVGLKKIRKGRDIPTPGLGYWAKVAHGKTVRRIPLPAANPEQSDIIVIHGSSAYGAPHVSREAEADWVERDSQPEYRVTANFTDEYRHPLVLATAEHLRKHKTDGWLVALTWVRKTPGRSAMPVGTPENYLWQIEPALHGLTNPEAPSLVTVVVINGNLPTPSSWSRGRPGKRRTIQ